jgi:capsular polysaccharide transport system permease protein
MSTQTASPRRAVSGRPGGIGLARSSTGQLSLVDGIAEQGRIIFALMLRQMKKKGSDTRLGYIWEILEPTVLIVGLSLVLEIRRGNAPVGESYPVFLATGYLPFKAFFFIANDLRKSFGRDSRVLDLPAIHQFDSILATLMLRSLSTFLIIVMIMVILNALGYHCVPDDPIMCFAALFWIMIFALGFGLVTAALTMLSPVYSYLHSILTFKLMFISGVFFLPEQMPPELRYYLSFNPLLHAIAWFRSGFIPGFESALLDREYLIRWAVLSLGLGIVLARVLRSRLAGEDKIRGEEEETL